MTDLEIANQNVKQKIQTVASSLNLSDDELECYGSYKAKIKKEIAPNKMSKLILVTAMNPTPYGEGKTTVSIGLADALQQLQKKVALVLRQPSMGPVFGMKGGATGGGYSQVVPMEDINLHFTGDFHAITSCNNLLCAAIDNHIKQGNELNIDPDRILFHRCLDVNDRALREVEIGLGGSINGTARKERFTITAASEIMALFCLAHSLEDLKKRLGNIIVAYRKDGTFVFARDLKIEGAMTVLLKDAFLPNLVQTLEHTPTLIHGGPFANIAHGCNSIVATKLGLTLADYVVTETGFGADLGAEKFFDIKCREGNLTPNCVVLVATLKALKYNAGVSKETILEENVEAVTKGLANLEVHMKNLKKFGVPLVVCLNAYDTDCKKEQQLVLDYCAKKEISCCISRAYKEGGKGALDLAEEVLRLVEMPSYFKPLYPIQETIMHKIETIAKEIYHAQEVCYSDLAKQKIKELEQKQLSNFPICMAKTQYSISDDPKKLGAPSNFAVTVKDVYLYRGAGFITVLLGDIMTMPGLPKHANFEAIDLTEEGSIVGIF